MVVSSPPFLDRKEVKDVLAFLKLFANRNDDESFRRAASLVQGIGDSTMDVLNAIAKQRDITLVETINLPDLDKQGLKTAVLNRLNAFKSDLNQYFDKAQKENCYLFAREIVLKYNLLSKYKNQSSDEDKARAGNVEELLNWVNEVSEEIQYSRIEDEYASGEVKEGVELKPEDMPPVTIGDFLENASLLSAVDTTADDNKVKLMTIHASKGLEFPYVFVAGMEENIFPSGGFYITETELEEERRLFYVAMTRAKKSLELSFAISRFRNGKHESNSPSRFIREVDAKYIQNPLSAEQDEEKETSFTGGWKKPSSFRSGYSYGQSSRPVVEKRNQDSRQAVSVVSRPSAPVPVRRPQPVQKRVPDSEFEPTPILQLRAGQRIEHNRFGFGKIIEISGDATDLKARILFDNHGEKILLLKYAKIRALNLGQ